MKRTRGRSARNGRQGARRPPTAQVIWRVMQQQGKGLDACATLLDETMVEREALRTFRDLRGRGSPVLVVRWQIYRVQINPRGLRDAERFAFVEAYSRRDACARVAAASAGVDRCALSDARARILIAKSYEDCLRDGLSADLELRLFEVAWSNGKVSGWVHEPMFWLRAPSTLPRKWSQIREGSLR